MIKVGDNFKEGDVLFNVDTDKTTSRYKHHLTEFWKKF